MNGIKKVFHRNSTSSVEDLDATSPKSATSNLSSAGNTSVDEYEPIAGKAGKHGGSTTTSQDKSIFDKKAAGAGATAATTTTTTTHDKAAIAKNAATGKGRSEEVATADGALRHSHGHNSNGKNVNDLTNGKVTQSVEHMGEITSTTHHTHNVEEVERLRELERHQHHIQVHHQPIKSEEHAAEKAHVKTVPVTHIQEKHASTDKDAKLLSSIAAGHGHKNETKHAPVQHQIVDRGEKVNETIHHHIHNVVVPLVSHDAHEHHRIKTTIPTHHVLHEAPVIHESSTLEPVSRDEFLKRGGVLGSKISAVEQANLLHSGTCERKVDGVAEKMAQELKLAPSAASKAF